MAERGLMARLGRRRTGDGGCVHCETAAARQQPLRLRDVTKWFGTRLAATHGEFVIERGSAYGLLGPNGAGKTTTIRMLTGVLAPSEGTVEVLGHDLSSAAARRCVKRRIGVVPQGVTLDSELTVGENLTTFAAYHGIPGPVASRRAATLLDAFDLAERAGSRTDELSGGMQRKLLICRALVNDPEVLVLDEPSTGLDPQARRLVWDSLDSFRRSGKTLLITSHYLEEIERLCKVVGVMLHGKVVDSGTPAALVRRITGGHVVTVHGWDPGPADVDELTADPRVMGVDIDGARTLVHTSDVEAARARLARQGVDTAGCRVHDATLEDAFLHLVGRWTEPAGAGLPSGGQG